MSTTNFLCRVCLTLIVLSSGCTSVSKMKQQYDSGDESKFHDLVRIVGDYTYPYSTRKKAARALGEIGDKRAVPALVRALVSDADGRDGLEKEAIIALGKIKDSSVVPALAAALTTKEELTIDATRALGEIGGPSSVEVLVNMIKFYTSIEERMHLKARFRDPTGVLEDEDSPDSSEDKEDKSDLPTDISVGKRDRRPVAPGGFFGGPRPLRIEEKDEADKLAEQMEETVAAMVKIGDKALPVLTEVLDTLKPGEERLGTHIADIISRITENRENIQQR